MSQTVIKERANVITGGWGAAVKRRNATRALLRSYSVSVDQYSALHLGKLVLPMEEAVPTRNEAVPVSVRKAISLVREQTCTGELYTIAPYCNHHVACVPAILC